MKDDSGKYRVIETSVIPEVTEVRYYEETIDKIKEHHPEVPAELPCVDGAITNTVINPTRVEKSYNNSYIYVDENTTNASGDALQVPVRVVQDTSARLKGAYFATRGGQTDVVWARPDEAEPDED